MTDLTDQPTTPMRADRDALRDLIVECAADLSKSEPFWTAGCLADILIAKGVTVSPDVASSGEVGK